MFATRIELLSTRWRAGMIDGLTAVHALAAPSADCAGTLRNPALEAVSLFHRVQRELAKLAPVRYLRYLRAWRRRTLRRSRRFHTRPLTSYQWRARALVTARASVYSAPTHRDGVIDALHLALVLLRPGSLDAALFADTMLEYLDALWPEDYRRYRYHHAQAARAQRAANAVPAAPLERLDYRAWSAAVRVLSHTARHNSARTAVLRRLLLLAPTDPTPTLAWQPPPKFAELSTW